MTGILSSIFFFTARLILGGIFLYAGATKIGDATAFAGDIAAYKLLPYSLNYVVAAVLPWLEAICGTLLILGFKIRATALLIVVLNIIFIGALAAAWARGLDIDCGCFQQAGKTSIASALLRDVVFLAMAAVIYRRAAAFNH